jgi:hypothetical protein
VVRSFRVKNFEKFQHYKDRAPPWIKLYNELLDDYEFGLLPDASKMHLVAIWLLASRSENKIPFDPAWVGKRINATEKVNLTLLESRGFIVVDQEVQSVEQDASTLLAKCLSREREEGETEESRIIVARAPKNERFEELRKAYPKRKGSDPGPPAAKIFLAAVKAGADPQIIIDGARRFAVEESQNINTPYIPQLVKWLRDKRWLDAGPQGQVATRPDIRGSLI